MRAIIFFKIFSVFLSTHAFATLDFFCEGNEAKILTTEEDGAATKIDLTYKNKQIYVPPIFNVQDLSSTKMRVSGLVNDGDFYSFEICLQKPSTAQKHPINFSTTLVLSDSENLTKVDVHCTVRSGKR
jgi:hypothetical protein